MFKIWVSSAPHYDNLPIVYFTYNNIMLGSSEVEERVPTAGVFIFSRSDKHNDKINSHSNNYMLRNKYKFDLEIILKSINF